MKEDDLVRRAQAAARNAGWPIGQIDGVWGPAMQRMVSHYHAITHLNLQPDKIRELLEEIAEAPPAYLVEGSRKRLKPGELESRTMTMAAYLVVIGALFGAAWMAGLIVGITLSHDRWFQVSCVAGLVLSVLTVVVGTSISQRRWRDHVTGRHMGR